MPKPQTHCFSNAKSNHYLFLFPVAFFISMRADFKDIKAIVVDIDGTLTDMSRHINLEAVRELRQLPIPVVLSSGNVICFVRAAAKLLGASDMMIGENGGVVQAGYDAKPSCSPTSSSAAWPRRAAEGVPRT